ncbi:MAG TPA: gliding motility-associated C-terminal domain-containing protein, partial [Bacteroidia bacterium]|nr:gliding motility-associated C-terminal domain-containing protein [Bacteroidia bacterium]
MKRFLSSCFLILLSFSFTKVSAQAFNFSITPQILCFNSSGTNTVLVAVTATQAAAGSYTWVIQSPPCGNATQTNVVPNGSIVLVTYPCCGDYTITGFPYAAISPTTPIGSPVSYTGTAVCPTSATITPSAPSNTVCAGNTLSLTAGGATTFTWTSSAAGGGTTTSGVNPLVITPTANATYTMNGLTAQGCNVTTTLALYVQSATLSAIPASQSVCPTSPLCFTTTAGAVTGTNVTAGTTTTGIQWYNPSAVAVSGCTSAAAFGTYTAVLTHTGAAGSCTLSTTAQVFTVSTIPVTLTASSPSICPGGTVQLTSISAQTSAVSNHTWTQSSGGFIFSNGNPIVRTITTFTAGPRIFTVDVNYFGCPGQATISIGLLTLTPTLTPSSFSVCPNRSLTLNATGGVNYTIIAVSGTGSSLTIGTGTSGMAVHTPSAGGFLPNWNYVVNTTSTGCTGSSTIAVSIRTIQPIFLSSTPSVCPGTNFTLSSNGGTGTSYTFVALPATVLQTGATNTLVQSIANATSFPKTYSVHVDSAGCLGDATHTVQLLVLNPTVALSSPSVCQGTSFSFTSSGGAGTSYTFYAPTFTTPVTGSIVAKADATTSAATHTPNFTPTLSTTYTVTVDSAGCQGSGTFSVGILNLSPNITLGLLSGTAQITSACPNSPITLTATAGGAGSNPSNFTYTFSAPPSNTLTGTSNTPSLAVIAPSLAAQFPATYTVFVDSASCVGSQTVNLALRVLNRGLIAGSPSVCAGTSVIVCAIPANSLTLYSFIQVSAAGNSTTSPSTLPCFTFNPTQASVYSVYADSAQCTNVGAPVQTVVVGMTPSLVITASASPSLICSGLPSTLSVIGSTAYTYTWTAPSGTNILQIGTNTTTVVNPTINTNYTVSALDAAGCVGNATVNVMIDPTASLSMNITAPQNTICINQSNTLTATGAVNYTWTPSTLLSAPNSSITLITIPSNSPNVNLVYTVSGNNGAGCNGAATFTQYVNSIPVLTIVPSATAVCSGFNATLTAWGSNSYTWTGSTYTGAIVQQSISVANGVFTVIGSNGGSCLSTPTAITIYTAPPLAINISMSTPTTCLMQNFPPLSKVVNLTANGAANYVWFPYDPATMTYSIGPQTQVRPHSTTCYTITGNTSVCSGSALVCVSVTPQFTIGVNPTTPAMCTGDSMKLSVVNIGPGAVGSQAAFSYSWTEANPITLSSPLSPTTMAYPPITTTYSVDVTDTRSCVSMPRLITVTVLPRPITDILWPIINNVPTNTVCFVGPNPGPSDVVLNLTAVNGNANLPFGVMPTYTWTSPNNSILTPPNNTMVTVSAPNRTPSIVVYTVVSGFSGVTGCREVDTVSVRVIDCRPITLVSFTTAVERDTLCARDCITFMNLTDTLAGGPQKLSWQFPGGSPATSTLSNPTICYNLPGKYNVILKVENPYPRPGGSVGQNGKLNYINVVDKPNVTIEPPGQLHSDRYIRFGETIELTGSGALSYLWDPIYNISSATETTVKVNPLKTTQYVLWGYNSKNCMSSDTINVIVVKECGEMYVPNAFSPNGDGHNDDIKVQGICLETMTFMIFKQKRKKVFESTNQNEAW